MKTILIAVEDAFLNNKIFSFEPDGVMQESGAWPLVLLQKELLQLGYELKTIDQGDIDTASKIIFMTVASSQKAHLYFNECIKRGYNNKMIFWLWEPPSVIPQQWDRQVHALFSKVYTWNDDLVDGVKYFKFHLPVHYWSVEGMPFNQKKFCTMIACNKSSTHPLELYSERVRAVKELERLYPYDFDLYGVNWDKPTLQIHNVYPYLMPRFPSYRGRVESKGEILKKYKFSICYENLIGVPGLSGFITEKILHSFMAGCVPVYLGANNITSYIPEDTFIDRRKFNTYEKLFAYLVNISEEEYSNYVEKARNYLLEGMYVKTFSTQNFVILMAMDLVR